MVEGFLCWTEAEADKLLGLARHQECTTGPVLAASCCSQGLLQICEKVAVMCARGENAIMIVGNSEVYTM